MNAHVAAAFDMDGTLDDNMGIHALAWMQFAKGLGVDGLSAERFEQHYAGKKNDEIFPDLLQRAVSAQELRTLAWDKEALYRSMAAPHLKPMPGLLAFLGLLRSRGISIALATAAPLENRVLVLEACGLRDGFDVIVGAEDVVRGKPAPDIFLAAAARLGIDPTRCIAFEDGKNGVLSARAAGMEVVGVVTTTPAATLLAAGCFCTLTDFSQRPAALDDRLFQ